MNSPLNSALEYARAGYRVIPVNGKIPMTRHGAHDATTDEATIRKWWAKWPAANIGMTLADLVVVDIDPRNGGDVATLPHPLPATCIAQTGGNGLHYLFKAAAGTRYAGRLARGVDMKTGSGAYIVVAPSIHASGNAYRWQVSPLDTAPTDAPTWIADTSAAAETKAREKARKTGDYAPRNIVTDHGDVAAVRGEWIDCDTGERITFNAETEAALA